MKITFLGTGTSTGIPLLGCNCSTCQSSDLRDRRLRTSVWIQLQSINIIIDAGIDFRQQALLYQIPTVDAVIFTHHHVDHIFGLDDLRPINFIQHKTIDIYGNSLTMKHLQRIYPYVFNSDDCPSDIPKINWFVFDGDNFTVHDIVVTPIPVYHGELLIHGFRIGNFAYLTDVSRIPPESYLKLKNLDILVLGALRERPHPTHFTLKEALDEAQKIDAQKTYLVHISHELSHQELLQRLPTNIQPAYDGLTVEMP